MKQSLSPAVIAGAVVGLLAVVGIIFALATRSPAGSQEGQNVGSGIPPEISKQIGERMAGAGGAGTTAPPAGRPMGMGGGGGYRPGGGMMAPPPGASGMGGR